MISHLLDSSAWIEYLKGTEKGAYVCSLVEGGEAATSVLSLAEVDCIFHKEKKETQKATTFMQRETSILPVEQTVASKAGSFRNERRKKRTAFSLIDSLLYLTAQEKGLTLLTKDTDFEGLPGVELL